MSKKGKLPRCLVEKKAKHAPRPDIREWLIPGDQKEVAIRFSLASTSRISRMLAGTQPPDEAIIKALEEKAINNRRLYGNQ